MQLNTDISIYFGGEPFDGMVPVTTFSFPSNLDNDREYALKNPCVLKTSYCGKYKAIQIIPGKEHSNLSILSARVEDGVLSIKIAMWGSEIPIHVFGQVGRDIN